MPTFCRRPIQNTDKIPGAVAVLALCLALLTAPVRAESLVATRTLRAGAVVAVGDLALVPAAIPGALATLDAAIGLEARVALYAGRPIRADQLVSPALIQRNQTVILSYQTGPLIIATEGRALDRGALGEAVAVLNLSSRTRVLGRVTAPGAVTVLP